MSIENFRIKYLHKSVKQEEKSTIMKKKLKMVTYRFMAREN